MKRTTLYAAIAALATSFAAAGHAQTMIKVIDVETDLTAIQNEKAAAYWGKLSDDLKSAIATRITDQLGEEGSEIHIDINELSLANSFQNALGIEDAVLVGDVAITNATDNTKFDGYELTVTAKTASAFAPDGVVLDGAFTDSPEYYTALVSAFADGVVKRLK